MRVNPTIMKISHLGGYCRLIHKVGSDTPILSSLMPDSTGHKPKHNDKSSNVALRNSITNCSLMALSCQSWSINSWCVSAWGLMGLSPRQHVIDWQTKGKSHSFEILPTVNTLIRRRGHNNAWILSTSSFLVRIEMLRLMNKMSAKILNVWIGWHKPLKFWKCNQMLHLLKHVCFILKLKDFCNTCVHFQ